MMNRIAAHHRFLCFYKVLAYKAAKLKIFAEPLIQFCAFGKAAVDEADRLDGGADNGLVVGQAEDVLNEDVFDALLAQGKARHETVAAAQRRFERHLQTRHDGIRALLVQGGEVDALGTQKLVACMLDVVLVVGIVHDALKVAFIIAHLHFQRKDIFFHK